MPAKKTWRATLRRGRDGILQGLGFRDAIKHVPPPGGLGAVFWRRPVSVSKWTMLLLTSSFYLWVSKTVLKFCHI